MTVRISVVYMLVFQYIETDCAPDDELKPAVKLTVELPLPYDGAVIDAAPEDGKAPDTLAEEYAVGTTVAEAFTATPGKPAVLVEAKTDVTVDSVL